MLDNYDNVMVKTNQDGVDKVLSNKEEYAFLMESASIDYEVQRKCTLRQVGNLLDSKGYGVVMPKSKLEVGFVSGLLLIINFCIITRSRCTLVRLLPKNLDSGYKTSCLSLMSVFYFSLCFKIPTADVSNMILNFAKVLN